MVAMEAKEAKWSAPIAMALPQHVERAGDDRPDVHLVEEVVLLGRLPADGEAAAADDGYGGMPGRGRAEMMGGMPGMGMMGGMGGGPGGGGGGRSIPGGA